MSVQNSTSSEVELEAARPITHHDDEIPRMEPWLWVLLAALVPVVLAFVLPRSLMTWLFCASGLLVLVGLVIFATQERRNRLARSAMPRP